MPHITYYIYQYMQIKIKSLLTKSGISFLLGVLFITGGAVAYATANIPVECSTPGDCDEITSSFKNLTSKEYVRLTDADDSNFVGFQAPATVVADMTWTLPSSDGSNGQVLSTNALGTLSWVSLPSGIDINGLSAESAIDGGDSVVIYDVSAGVNKKMTRADFLSGILGSVVYQGTWDATGNTPTLSDGTGAQGNYHVASTAGTIDLGSGNITFSIGDWVIHNGSVWEKLDNVNDVQSVFGRVGVITATAGDYDADQIDNTPAGNIAATNVQAAIDELDTEKISTSLTSANLLVGNGSNVATGVALSGDVTMDNTGAITIADDAVDGTDISLTSEATGDVMYFDGTDWVRLPAGTAEQVLVMNAGATAPEWVTLNGGSSVLDLGRSTFEMTSITPDFSDDYDSYRGSLSTGGFTVNAPINLPSDDEDPATFEIQVDSQSGGSRDVVFDSAYVHPDGSALGTVSIAANTKHTFVFALSDADNSPVQATLIYSSFDFGNGGGASDFASLTDTDVTGVVAGAINYFDGTNWVDLPAGTAGQTLVMDAGATAPEWVTGTTTEVTDLHRASYSSTGTAGPTVTSNVIPLSNGHFDAIYDPFSMRTGDTFVVQQDGDYSVEVNIAFNDSLSQSVVSIRVNGSAVSAVLAEGITADNPVNSVNYMGSLLAGDVVDFHVTDGSYSIFGASASIEQLPSKTVINAADLATDDQSASGYIDIGNMRMQWGIDTSANTGVRAITFPAPFADTGYVVTVSPSALGNETASAQALSTTQFNARIWEANTALSTSGDISWQAIGLKP